MNPLLELQKHGQSIWLDFITRRLMDDGSLGRLIQNDGLRGVTSNPTIFQKAIAGSSDYDASIEHLLGKELDAHKAFETVAIEDIQKACDVFAPVYRDTKGLDGYVSLEVSPHLARDTRGTIAEARDLNRRVARPNVMIKIPATVEGLPAIEEALGDGINVNVTLIFSLERYGQVINAWMSGLEKAAKAGKPLAKLASVASFFVSRVDGLVDGLLEKRMQGAPPAQRAELESLQGQAAIANARAAYQMFRKLELEPRYKALMSKGAQPQRPLWASTSTKNPRYRDVLYVEELIGKDTVNTLPPQTVDAFRDHGRARDALSAAQPDPVSVLQRLEQAGIDMGAVTRQLEEEGVKAFNDSYDALLKSIEDKRKALSAR